MTHAQQATLAAQAATASIERVAEQLELARQAGEPYPQDVDDTLLALARRVAEVLEVLALRE